MKKKRLISLLLIVVVSVLNTGCFSSDNDSDDITVHRQHLTLNGRNLYYELPDTSPPPGGYPAFIAYHGMTQNYGVWYQENTTMYLLPNDTPNMLGTENQTNLVKFARDKGIVILMPDSLDIRISNSIMLGAGQKGFDLVGTTMEDNHDHPFTRDMLDWLENDSPVEINNDQVIAVGICGGAVYSAGVQHVPELRHRFAAYVIGAGGYPPHIAQGVVPGISSCDNGGWDCESDIDIPSDTAPTVMAFGMDDLIVRTAYSQNYLRNLLEAGVPVLEMTGAEDFPLDWPGHSYPDPSRNFEERALQWIFEQIK